MLRLNTVKLELITLINNEALGASLNPRNRQISWSIYILRNNLIYEIFIDQKFLVYIPLLELALGRKISFTHVNESDVMLHAWWLQI